MVTASYNGDVDHQGSVGGTTLSVVYNFMGFLPPLVQGGDYKQGRTIPVKFQLTDANGNFISTATAQIWVDSMSNPGSSSGTSNNGNNFRFDPSSNTYIFNLSTQSLSAGQHTIIVTLDDETSHSITINLSS